jgi:hypothetical protein
VQRGRIAEVRYRFHTRNLEMHPLLKRLSRKTPDLTFALASHCLDDGDFGAFTIRKGKVRGDWLGDDWRTPFWERAAKTFNMPLDETWEDSAAESIAESWMRDAAVRIATGSARDYDWAGGRLYREFENERANTMVEIVRALETVEREKKRGQAPRG